MPFRNWRFTTERLQEITEKAPKALEDFNRALKSIPQLAGLKEPIETAVESMMELSKDLMAAREYLNDADALADRLQARVEKLEGMIGVRVINNQVPAPDPTRGFPARFSEGGPMEPTSAAGDQGPTP